LIDYEKGKIIMEWWLTLIIAFGSLIIFLITGLPVAFSFLALVIIGLLSLQGINGLILLPGSILDSVAFYTLTPIPLFILLGEILFQSHAVDVCYNAMDKCVGSIRARLHIVTLIFSVLFGAISGAAMATCAILGSIVYPEMVRRGYDKKLSLGVILAGSTLDPLIPPSVLAVVVASMANVSVAKLLISGVGPGLMMGAVYIAYIVILMRIKPGLAPSYQVSSTFREKMVSIGHLLPFLIIIFLVLGLLLLGIATPTESAATGVMGAFIISAFFGHLTFDVFKKSLINTIKITAPVLFILASSKAYSQVIAISGGAHGLVQAISNLSLDPIIMLVILQGVPFILGCFIDQYSIMMITIPIYLPLVDTLQYDPLWFWCLYLINMTIGGITPPFGLILFVLKSAAKDTHIELIYKSAIPFFIMMLLGIVLLFFFPEIAVWLPNKMSQ
jgi:tripartite ATP-independent transporter DctM subunit